MINLSASDVLRLFTPSGAIDNSDQILFYSVASGVPVKISAKLLRAYLNAEMDITINNQGFLVINGKVTEWNVSQDIVGLSSRLESVEDKLNGIERGTFASGDSELGVSGGVLSSATKNLNVPTISLSKGDILSVPDGTKLVISSEWKEGASVTEIVSNGEYVALQDCFVSTYTNGGTIDYAVKRGSQSHITNIRFEDNHSPNTEQRALTNNIPLTLNDGYPDDGTLVYILFNESPTASSLSISLNGSSYMPIVVPSDANIADCFKENRYYGFAYDSSIKSLRPVVSIGGVDSGTQAKIDTMWNRLYPFTYNLTGGGTFERGKARSVSFSWSFSNGMPSKTRFITNLTKLSNGVRTEITGEWTDADTNTHTFSTTNDTIIAVLILDVDNSQRAAYAYFVYPLWTNESNITAISKKPVSSATTLELSFVAETNTSKHTFHIPKDYTLTGVKVLNTLSNKYEDYSMDNFVMTGIVKHPDASGVDIEYYEYRRNDGTNGATKFQVTINRNDG